MKVYQSITELVGRTPLLELGGYGREQGLEARILAKLEYFNPAGSVKDRVAMSMLEEAEASGRLRRGGTIIEPTSGNTGIGLAALGAARGYRVIITMPDTMSEERRRLMKAYGAELVLTEGAKGMRGAMAKAEELKETIPGAIVAGQFVNPANPAAHLKTTGPEIWEDTEGQLDFFVAGIGTGGTISGVGAYLKERSDKVRVIGAEPDTSAVLSGDKAGKHGLQGIGAGFVPEVLDTGSYDEIMRVTDEEAFAASRTVAKSDGILVGISSGAALAAATRLAKRPENKGKCIVVLLPDTGERYLSTELFPL